MSEPVIKVENLSKQYRIGEQESYKTFREAIVRAVRTPLNRMRGTFCKSKNYNALSAPRSTPSSKPSARCPKQSPNGDLIWALKDVSFDVKQGEVIGIIGRNGAGKSTLLKILSRITEPTRGRVELKGRVGSLLEVGTGFHPELTGHENIYLYGAILGMDRWEVTKKFDEIVLFSELEKFIDTPVKRYSSGMYTRLAFAVAAHLEPEILLVDEVLSVGDAHFQKKCLGKMKDVSKNEGRTVFFVSHNMQSVRNLCTRAISLESGRLAMDGEPSKVTDAYLHDTIHAENQHDLADIINNLPSDPAFRLKRIEIRQEDRIVGVVTNGSSLEIEVEYSVLKKTTGLRVYFDICDLDGTLLFRSFHDEQAEGIPFTEPGRYMSTASIPPNVLGPITYVLKIHASIYNVRSCTPLEGVSLRLPVEQTGRFNKAYPADTFRQKLALVIPWDTRLAEYSDEKGSIKIL